MPCLLAILALAAPRFVIFLLWLFSDYLGRALSATTGSPLLFNVLGFLFMPFTLLAYAAAINEHGSVDGPWIVLVVVAVVADLAAMGNGERKRRSWAA